MVNSSELKIYCSWCKTDNRLLIVRGRSQLQWQTVRAIRFSQIFRKNIFSNKLLLILLSLKRVILEIVCQFISYFTKGGETSDLIADKSGLQSLWFCLLIENSWSHRVSIFSLSSLQRVQMVNMWSLGKNTSFLYYVWLQANKNDLLEHWKVKWMLC